MRNARKNGDSNELLKTKALVFQREIECLELNHRIANNLQIAASFLTVNLKRLDNEIAKDTLAAASARIAAISKFHRYLYRHGTTSRVDLKAFLEDLGPAMALGAGLTCTVDAEAIEVSSDMAQQLAIAVNEFAINAGKHAYCGEDGGPIEIGCWRHEDARLRLSVSDHGVGLPDNFDPAASSGLGLAIVVRIANQLGAELLATNDHGARFTLLVPVSQSSRSGARIPPQALRMSLRRPRSAPHDQAR